MTATLEEDILLLEKLDRLRTDTYRLRDDGLQVLLRAHIERKRTNPADRDKVIREAWYDSKEEPNDYIQPALQFHVATSHFAYSKDSEIKALQEFRQDHESKLLTIPIEYLFDKYNVGDETPDVNTQHDAPLRSRVEIFQAARAFHALVRSPRTIFSRASMLTYYRVVRELYSVAEPSWLIGSARASEGGVPTAFMAGECTRAINAFARAIERTADLVNLVFKRYQSLKSLLRQNNSAPPTWLVMELTRQMMSMHNKVADLKRHAFLEIGDDTLNQLVLAEPPYGDLTLHRRYLEDGLIAFMKSFSTAIASAASKAANEAKLALDAIDKRMRREIAAATKDDHATEHPDAKVTLAHSMARHSIDTVVQLAKGAITASALFDRYVDDKGERDDENKIKSFLDDLRGASKRTRRVFTPAKTYVESILDRELAKGATGRVRVGELTFAAATYAQIERPARDSRLANAINLVLAAISEDGTFDSPGHLDTDASGYSLILLGSEVVRALAQLLDRTRIDVPLESLERLLVYFETTSIRVPEGGTLAGWCHDMPRNPRRASSWTTALAVLALDRIGRMLDATINRRVGTHFSTRSGQELRDTCPTLGSLVYPDYGTALSAPQDLFPTNSARMSIAFLLERMRAHVLGLPPLPGVPNPCHAVILHGPPGTGKTTLIEALAASTKRELFEVTPSDFLVEGEAFVEKRARVVFSALSLLTNTVVVFDEFDPMLRSRETEPVDGTRSVFSFLTPGLLPKLKNLNVRAKRRFTAFCLITNRIGTLDDAAIRSGRFDYKIGIYPPDPVSRAGYVAMMLDSSSGEVADWSTSPDQQERAVEVVSKSGGAAMTMLSAAGNLRPLRSGKPYHIRTMLYHIAKGKLSRYDPGPPDADFEKAKSRSGSGVYHDYETRQWSWIHEWDSNFAKVVQNQKLELSTTKWAQVADLIEKAIPSK